KEDNQNNNVIIIKDDQDMTQFKKIYVKNKNRLKVVDFDKGVIFNQALSDTENDTNDNKSESNDNNTVEKDKEGSKEQKQKSEIEEFTEYSILDKKLDMD